MKEIIKTTLSSEEQNDISNESKQQHKDFCQILKNETSENVKLNNDEFFEIETIDDDSNSEVSDFSESDEDEVIDYSNYIKTTETDEEIKQFFKMDSEKYQEVLTKKGSNVLEEKATVYPKVQNVPNKVFEKAGCTSKETSELIHIMEVENSQNQKSSFWKMELIILTKLRDYLPKLLGELIIDTFLIK